MTASQDAAPNQPLGAVQVHQACVRAKAAQIGTRETITEEQADAIVGQCRDLLSAAVSEVLARMQGQPMTNLPKGLETEQSRVSVATDNIEYAAKELISGHIRPRAVP
jgi:hypothetical protein